MATIPVGYQMTPGGIKPIPGGIADPNRANDPTLKLDKTTDKGSVFVGERDSTGQRNEVFIRGNQVATPPPTTKLEAKVSNAVFKSDRDEAKSLLTGRIGETGDVAKEYGISTEGFPTTLQGQVDLLKAQSADQKTEAQRRLEFDFQRQQQEVGDFKKAGETTVESVIANLAQGREGAVSSSAQQAISKFSTDMQEQIGRAISGLEEAQARKNYALRELDRAEAAGNFDLAEQIKGQIARAESDIRTERTNVLNAQAQAVDTALKVDQNLRQNMSSFTGVLDSGVNLTAEGALGLAKQFNIPSEIALDYFTATEQIRNDKKLDQTAKEIALDQAEFNFENAVTGKALEQANKVKYYEEQVKNGADPETLAVMLDIPNEYNPVYKADLALKKAQAEIERAEANGQPIGWKERQEYMQYLADKQYATGQVDVVLPSKPGRFGITPTAGGILVDVMEGDKPDVISTVRDEGQCGAFVNDTLGTALGDSFKDKMAKTDPYAMPKPGMFFVQQTAAQWGHCGIVESINEDGTLNIVEANYGEPGTVGRRYNVPVTDFAGFGTPPNAKTRTTGTSNVALTADQIKILKSWDGKKIPEAWSGNAASFREAYNQFQTQSTDPNISLTEKMRFSAGGKELLAQQSQKMDSFATVVTGLQNLESKLNNIDSDALAPLVGVIQNKNPWDTKRKEIDAILTSITPGLARGVYGEVGVLTDTDVARYQSLLPTLKDTKSQREALLNLLKESLATGVENTIRSAAASGRDVSGFTDLVEYVSDRTSGGETQYSFDINSPAAKTLSDTLQSKGIQMDYNELQADLDEYNMTIEEYIDFINNNF